MLRSFVLCRPAMIAAALASVLPAAAQPTFTGLGPATAIALDISGDTHVVVGYGRIGLTAAAEAFRWSAAAGASNLGPNDPWYRSTVATGVSYDGTVIVGQEGNEAFRWTSATGRVGLGIPVGSQVSGTTGVSRDAAVIIGSGQDPDTGTGQAFRWTDAAGMTLLGSLPGRNSSHATGVSGDGSVVVGYGGQFDYEAFRWTADGGMIGLGAVKGASQLYSYAQAISDDGTTIVGLSASASGYEAFRWTADGGMTGLDEESGIPSVALAVSGDGGLIVGNRLLDDSSHDAFVWTRGSGMRSLLDWATHDLRIGGQFSGWSDLGAYAVSDDGRYVAGDGFHGAAREAWLLDRGPRPPAIRPPGGLAAAPEPASFAWAGAMLLIVAGAGRRWRRRNAENR